MSSMSSMSYPPPHFLQHAVPKDGVVILDKKSCVYLSSAPTRDMCLAFLTLHDLIALLMFVEVHIMKLLITQISHSPLRFLPLIAYQNPVLSLQGERKFSTPTQSINKIKITVFWIFITCSVMCSSETSKLTLYTTRCQNLEELYLANPRRENLKTFNNKIIVLFRLSPRMLKEQLKRNVFCSANYFSSSTQCHRTSSVTEFVALTWSSLYISCTEY
jgi:hypothetical protein